MNIAQSGLKTGVVDLDIDSEPLLGLINEAIRCTEPARLNGLKPSLVALDGALKARFAREDKLMTDCGYRLASLHRDEHQRLLAEINFQIVELYGGLSHTAFIGRFLKNWLLPHILGADVLLGNAVVSQIDTVDRRQETSAYRTGDGSDLYSDRRIGVREPIVWSEQLATGVDSIDQEHRDLINVLNSVIVCSNSGGRDELTRLLNQLGNATAKHFEQEEALMATISYEHAAAHRSEHRKLLDEFSHQVDDWSRDRRSAEFLCRFLYRWLLRHIVTSDIPFGAALKR